MPKHNNAIQRPHLRKHIRPLIRTFFDQAGQKKRRLQKRQQKASAIFPRPLSKLRPLVHKPTQRYSAQIRQGRGFTLEELKAVGLNKRYARTIGITVDTRRTNKSNESLQRNIQRLKEYVDKLIVLPKGQKVLKGGYGRLADSTETVDKCVQNTEKTVLPINVDCIAQKTKKITKEMNQFRPKGRLALEKMLKKQSNKKKVETEEN